MRHPIIEESLARYGKHIGTAFQLVDDALDYQADEVEPGKAPGGRLGRGEAHPPADLCHAARQRRANAP